MSEKIKVIAVVGPTASGKTALSVELAKRLSGEIISCDSMQIYRGMDIGTAKVTENEMRGVPHHLIDIAEPQQSFSCAEYAAAAREKIEEIAARGRVPIFCGGTGLYLDSVLTENEFSEACVSTEIREMLMRRSPDELYDELLEVDPESAEKTHKNNVKRVVRALEIFRSTGITKTEWDRRSRAKGSRYDAIVIGLDFKNRDDLYERINRRVDIMLDSGLVNEVRGLDCEAFRGGTAAQGIGYKEILSYLDGTSTLFDAAEEIKKNSRNYAKRQLTWFRRNKSVNWIFPDFPPSYGVCTEMTAREPGENKVSLIANHAENVIRKAWN